MWDISPPYHLNWAFFQLLRSSHALDGRGIVLTTTHKGHLDALVGHDSKAVEIVGKPYDLALLITGIEHALVENPATARA